MKLGLIADVHGNSVALEAVLRALDRQVDQIVFLGDLCGYYPFVNECSEMLAARPVVGVRGNHDQVLLDCLATRQRPPAEYRARYGSALERALQVLSPPVAALLHSWPLQRKIVIESKTILLAHGAPWDALGGRVYPDFAEWDSFDSCGADVVLLGHTHYPLVKRHRDKRVINPGSVGQARDRSGTACYGVLDLMTEEVILQRVGFCSQVLIHDAREHDPNLPYLETVLTR